MSKRRRERATIIPRGHKFAVVIDRGTVNGKRVRDWHSGFADYKSADRARTKLLAQLDANTYTPPSVLTVGAYLEDKWLPALRGQVKRPRTYSFHADNVRCHLLEGIGEIPLQKLDASDLDKLYGDLLEAGLAAVTIAHVHETASKALRQARRWKLVPSNVAADASPPEVPDRDMQVWNADELKVFLAATSGDRLAALWRLAAMTGLRRGEVLGLRWRDVDLERATLSVAKSKTASGKRAVALDTETVAALKRWRAQQNAERLQMGADWVDTGLTFTREDGDRVRESYVSHKFGRLVRQLGLPPIRLHDLRHGWATMALQSGIHPKVVQERLGHSTIAQTLDTYSHVIPGMHAAAAATVAALVAEVD